MHFRWSREDEAFRQELRSFIKEVLPADWTGYREGTDDWWEFFRWVGRQLGARRWLVLAWPEEYGGLNASYWQQLIFKEETGYHRVPGINFNGVNNIGPSIMIYGNEEQKRKYLPGIASGDLFFCQMFTEPEAGSDLGSLQTRAIRDGDYYIVNGQKIFIGDAHVADYGWLAARTDPGAPKHKGISTFVIPTNLPGITITPIIDAAGEHLLNQVFFDNVRLPAENLVGVENRGWYQMMTTLDFERSGMERWAPAKRLLDDLVDFAKTEKKAGTALPAPVRYRLADFAVMSEVGRYLAYRVTDMQTHGKIANHEASISKILAATLYQRLANFGVNLLGMYGPLSPKSKWAKMRGEFERYLLATIPTTISGGSLEIQHNVVAIRGLGLPRG